MSGGYLFSILVALDETLNDLTGGNPHHTVSYRAAVAAKEGKEWGQDLCAVLEAIDPGHCARALVHEARPDCTAACGPVPS